MKKHRISNPVDSVGYTRSNFLLLLIVVGAKAPVKIESNFHPLSPKINPVMTKLRYFLASTIWMLAFPLGNSAWNQAKAAETQAVTIRFQAAVGSQPFSCDESYTLGMPASQVTPVDFRFYVSDVALIDAQGNAVPLNLEQDGKWQYENVALLDFENKSGGCANGTVDTNDRIVGIVPVGDYKGLKFKLGVPFSLNHADATLAASPLNLTSLWWNWQLGYKFARIDLINSHSMESSLNPSSDDGSSTHKHETESSIGFPIHIGSTGCEMADSESSPSACSNSNTSTIVFSEFDPSQNVIVADLATLVANTNLSINQPNTAPGCMSEPNDRDCIGIMSALGILFNGTSSPTQAFFKLQ